MIYKKLFFKINREELIKLVEEKNNIKFNVVYLGSKGLRGEIQDFKELKRDE